MFTILIQRVFWSTVMIMAFASQACMSRSELNMQAKTTMTDATEKDKLKNGCFVSSSIDSDHTSRGASVVCPTVKLKK